MLTVVSRIFWLRPKKVGQKLSFKSFAQWPGLGALCRIVTEVHWLRRQRAQLLRAWSPDWLCCARAPELWHLHRPPSARFLIRSIRLLSTYSPGSLGRLNGLATPTAQSRVHCQLTLMCAMASCFSSHHRTIIKQTLLLFNSLFAYEQGGDGPAI